MIGLTKCGLTAAAALRSFRTSSFAEPPRVQPRLDNTATTLSRGLKAREAGAAHQADLICGPLQYFQALVWPHMPSRPTGPKHAVVNLFGIAVLKTQDVDQPHEANPESVAIRISSSVPRT